VRINLINFKIPIIYLIAILLSSCSKQETRILLLCEGIETISGSSDDLPKMNPESRNVTHSIEVFKDKYLVKEGIKYTDSNGSNDKQYKESIKSIWILTVDNGLPIREIELNSVLYNRHGYESEHVKVDESNISAFMQSIISYGNKNDKDYYERILSDNISINRINGKFERLQTESSNKPKGSFTTTTEGQCRRTEKKI